MLCPSHLLGLLAYLRRKEMSEFRPFVELAIARAIPVTTSLPDLGGDWWPPCSLHPWAQIPVNVGRVEQELLLPCCRGKLGSVLAKCFN